MQLSPWHGKADVGPLSPEVKVFTMELFRDPFGDAAPPLDQPQLCDSAWTTRAEVDGHFWRTEWPENVRVIEMTVSQYLARHCREINGMNPFWTIGRSEFMDRWRAEHLQGATS